MSFVWGGKSTKAPIATGLSGALQKCFQSSPALAKAGPDVGNNTRHITNNNNG